MAWSEITPEFHPGRAPRALVRIGMRGASRGFAAFLIMHDSIVCDRLGWTETTCLRLLSGSAESAGRIRLAPHPSGVVTVARLRGRANAFCYLRLGHWPGLPRMKIAAAAAEYLVSGEGFEIMLPQFWVSPPSIGVSPAAAARAETLSAMRPKGPRDVTASLMGDPPPRRAVKP